jgi:hypothetical protein
MLVRPAPETVSLSDRHAFCRSIRPREPLSEVFLRDLDPGIVDAVQILSDHGIETCQSCQGGDGHSYFEPTVDFLGGPAAGFAAISIARQHALPVVSLQRVWNVQGDEIIEVIWRITFQAKTGGSG